MKRHPHNSPSPKPSLAWSAWSAWSARSARVGSLAAALLLAGCFGPSNAELLSSARELMAKKEWNAAQLQLKTLLQEQPDSSEGRLLLGQAMLDGGNLAGAEAELRRALELGQSEARVLPALASAMVGLGKGALLLQQFGQVTLPEPQADAELKSWLATAEAGEGQLEAADARIGLALRASPDHAPALLLRARLAAARGDVAGAQAQVQALIDRQQDNADAWLLKAELLMAAAGTAQGAQATAPAIAAYQRTLALMPSSVSAHSAILGLQIRRGDFAAAATQWSAMHKALPQHPQTLFFEAVLAEQKGDFKRARELSQVLLRASPENPRTLMLAGQVELKLGNLAQAEAHLAKAAQLLPKATMPRRRLAQVQLRSGQADKALLTLRPMLEDKAPDIEALTLSAQALLMKGDTAGADASFARAAKLKPDNLQVRTAIALSALAKGQDSSLTELQAISAADTGSAADMALISALVRRKDYAGALKAVDALAAKQPKEPLPDQLRGRIALQRQDSAGARKHFEQALLKSVDYLPALAGLAALDMADKQPAAAKARFEAALQRNPKNTSAMLALAELSARSGGTPEETQRWLDQAVTAEPAEALPRQMLIDHLLSIGQQRPALVAAQAAVAALPENPELLDRLGRALLINGETQQAVSTFNKLATVAPRSALPQLRLADAHAAANNRSGMSAAVKRAVEIAPDQLQVRQAQLRLALMDNKPAEALAVAKLVQTQWPTEAVGFGMEGEIEMSRRNWDAAAAALRKALTRQQPGDSAQKLHAALVAAKKGGEADKMATDWRKSHPADLGFIMHLGDMAMAGGGLTQAEGFYREVLSRQPEHVLALNNLAYALALQKKPGAVALAEKALQQAPKAAAVMDTLAFSLAAEQQLPRAIEIQTQAVAAATAPEAHQFRLQLAKFLLQSGNKSDARTELDKLAALGKAFARQDEVAELIKQTGG